MRSASALGVGKCWAPLEAAQPVAPVDLDPVEPVGPGLPHPHHGL